MIEDAVMNATKNMLIEDLLPEVSLKCNDDAEKLINANAKINGLEGKVEQLEELINAKDAKISHQEKKNEELERLIKQLQQQVEVLTQKSCFFVPFIHLALLLFLLLMKPFIFRKDKGKSSFLPKDGDLEV